MDKNLYNLEAVTTVNDSDLLHVNQGGVSSDKKVTKQNLLKEVNSSITSLNNSLTNNSMTPMSVLSGRGTALDGGYCLVGNMVHINWKFKAGTSATNSPSISSTPPSPKTEAALSCIDITSGISSAIDGSVPCGVSAVGTLYLKEIANNHIYAITGTYIKL